MVAARAVVVMAEERAEEARAAAMEGAAREAAGRAVETGEEATAAARVAAETEAVARAAAATAEATAAEERVEAALASNSHHTCSRWQ